MSDLITDHYNGFYAIDFLQRSRLEIRCPACFYGLSFAPNLFPRRHTLVDRSGVRHAVMALYYSVRYVVAGSRARG